ncbi:MAG: nucleotidyl transferase AbiEii/AbiGii toxin family protein [bacterium]
MERLRKRQEQLLESLANSEMAEQFYFGGGSALAMFDLKHRLSVDLDFFSVEKISPEALEYAKNIIIQTFPEVSISYHKHYDRHIFTLTFEDNTHLELEFVRYPARRFYPSKHKIGQMEVEHSGDIFLDKLATIAMRNEIKDFVDIVAYIEKYGVAWDETIRLAEQKHKMAGLAHILACKFNTPLFDENTYKSLGYSQSFKTIISQLKKYAEEIVREIVRRNKRTQKESAENTKFIGHG